jgi:hypothetical protein
VHIAATGHHDIGLALLVVTCLFPHAHARRAMPLRRGLLTGDDYVDMLSAAQTMVGNR